VVSALKVLVIAPHADDETLGAGGTLLRHIARGDRVYWCVVTIAFADSPVGYRRERESVIQKVKGAYGFAGCHLLDFPAGELDALPARRLIDALSSVVQETKPDVVYSVGGSDVNTDHDVVYRCLMPAVKPSNAPFLKEILLYEVPSSTNLAFPGKAASFQPNVYVDIEKTLDAKLDILNLFRAEIKGYPHPRSIQAVKALAAYRGSSVNLGYAEAFCLVRRLVW